MADQTRQVISVDTGFLMKNLDKIRQLLTGKDRIWYEIGAFQKAKIEIRTAQGKNYNESNFKKYSKAYKKVRHKAGRPVDWVDLNFKGHMLASMNVKVIKDSAVSTFPHTNLGFPAEQSLKAAYNNKTRKFFRVPKKDKDAVIDMARAEISRLLQEANLT